MKYKFLKFGRCYTNDMGDKIILVSGNRKEGYVGLFICQHSAVTFHQIYLKSRIVIDNTWTEIDKSNVSEIASNLADSYGKQMRRIISPLIIPPHFDFSVIC